MGCVRSLPFVASVLSRKYGVKVEMGEGVLNFV